ncbi:hypothetical protein AUEXF2481DRAFT_34565 [Aureobasidium subglaciale EXF-2481]|uniref:Uncharacterized protein n=1 Tax=Aureobasidium subglaciale (strain EXF-2481) TaxID=1043005 RepID=A0A074ZPX7_AURSE|nr:uncharacterized protein AUEXF2481DRAFT_34565 [Aureobasidium subglaciale EXF-2481]KER00362.1 hypothetical protein AUEXF2481DRAFT_34565 [Aureobasidium subglaciale EXF-2481]
MTLVQTQKQRGPGRPDRDVLVASRIERGSTGTGALNLNLARKCKMKPKRECQT